MSIEEAVQRLEQCIQRFVSLFGKRCYFQAGLERIKQHLEETARELAQLKAEKSVPVRKRSDSRREAPVNPRDLAARPTR